MRLAIALFTALAVILAAWLEVGGHAMREGARVMQAAADEAYGFPGEEWADSYASHTNPGRDYAAYFRGNFAKLWPRTRSVDVPADEAVAVAE